MKNYWTESNIKQMKTFHNIICFQYPARDIKFDDYEFLDDYYTTIEKHYDKSPEGTKKNVYSLLYKYFITRYKTSKHIKHKKLADHFHSFFNEQRAEIKSKQKKGKDNLDYENMLILDDVKDKILEYEKKEFQNIDDNLTYLLLNVIYYGSLRTNFYSDLPIITDRTNEDKTKNYIFVNSKDAYYYVHHDKVSDTKAFNTEDRKIIKLPIELRKILLNSIKKYKAPGYINQHDNIGLPTT